MQKIQLTALLALLTSLFSVACVPEQSIHELNGTAWGTTYNIKIITEGEAFDSQEVQGKIAETLTRVDDQFSNWNPQSEVSVFNATKNHEFVELSPQFNDLIEAANGIHRGSDSYLDLTLSPIIELWGFGSSREVGQQDQSEPAAAAIAEAMALVGQDKVLEHDASGSKLRKINPEASLFLSALAKGAGIDAIDETLAQLGFDNYLIEVGGDLIAIGSGSRGTGWQIGIEQPAIGSRGPTQIVGLDGLAMATSGDYRNYFEKDGVRFSHIIDPNTGRPISHTTASVTVLSKEAVLADAWATALLAAGQAKGMEIAERENIAALFISRSDTTDSLKFESVSSSEFERIRTKP